MPCHTPEPTDAERRESYRHNSDVAEMLCAVCNWMVTINRFPDSVPGLGKWYEEHKKRDRVKAIYEADARRQRIRYAKQRSDEALAELNKLLGKGKKK